MTRRGPKEFGTEMPEILFVIDNDFEQRYYRSPEQMAKGVCGWFSDQHGRLHAYRRIDEGFNPTAVLAERDKHNAIADAEFNRVVGPAGYQPSNQAAYTAWEKLSKKLEKAKWDAVAAVLRRVR